MTLRYAQTFFRSLQTSSCTTFCVWLFNILHVLFYKMTTLLCLIVFISWDIGQCMYHNYFFQLVMASAVIFYFRKKGMSIHCEICLIKRRLYKSNQFILLQCELENATVKLILHRYVDSGNSTFQVEDICLALET